MKATRDDKFVPVTLILETQEEVDKLYSLGNATLISDAIGLYGLYSTLAPYCSPEAHKIHLQIIEKIQRKPK